MGQTRIDTHGRVAGDLDGRRGVALERTESLIAQSEARARQAWRNYYSLQVLTVGLAAITPCLIFLAKDNPRNDVLNWLQLFFPALAALCAGASHIFHWREDGVRNTQLAESLRSALWHFQTRTGDIPPSLTDEQALDHLVTRIDELHLRAVAAWSADRLAPVTAEARSARARTEQPAPPAASTPG